MGYQGHEGLPKVCVIGAGCAGFTTAKRLKDFNISYDCFEASDDVGGNWYFKNPNGTSACYQSLHIDTSKWRLAFEDFPIPEGFPDFPHHAQLLSYFRDYVAHFGLRETITFNTRVELAHRRGDGLWEVTLSTGETRLYDALFVCNGHHWDPRTPVYEGDFDGVQLHSHAYNDPFDPVDVRGKTVVVVGGGNSAMDIASELSQKPLAKKLFISMRRGVWVLPKYMNGQPADKAAMPRWMPPALGRSLAQKTIEKAIGRMEDYGLPKPDHAVLTAHPSVSGEFLTRMGCGDIVARPGIERFDGGKTVRFTDGTTEEVDVIVYATGYNVSFPFFDQDEFKPVENRFPLWKRMMKPGVNNLFFMGLAQPLPTLVNFPEQQSKLAVAYLAGKVAIPAPSAMATMIEADDKLYLGHFYPSPRHTMQLDFGHYVANLLKEITKGTKAAKASGHPLPVPARAAHADGVSNVMAAE